MGRNAARMHFRRRLLSTRMSLSMAFVLLGCRQGSDTSKSFPDLSRTISRLNMRSSSHTLLKYLSSVSTKQWMNSRIASSFCAVRGDMFQTWNPYKALRWAQFQRPSTTTGQRQHMHAVAGDVPPRILESVTDLLLAWPMPWNGLRKTLLKAGQPDRSDFKAWRGIQSARRSEHRHVVS